MRLGLSLTCLSICAAPLLAQNGPSFPLTHGRLKNGLEFILSEDAALPVVSVVVAYNVGSVHEPLGKTGLVYIMENLMMFSGSTNVPPRQHFNFISRVGGDFNAATSEDKTLFVQTVPSNQLALVLWLESDRMKSLEISEATFERARTDLLDDLRQRKAEPYFDSQLSFDQLIYSDFAHSHSVLGSEEDIRNLTVEDVRNFYAAYFTPNNAVLCITGNFNRQTARELVARYFETIPRGKDVSQSFEPLVFTRLPVVKTFQDIMASAPAFYLGFRIAPPYSNDFYTLSIVDYVLFRGRSSRLAQKLLGRDNKIAYQASGGIEKRKDRAIYRIFCVVNNLAMTERCQDAIFSELDRLKRGVLSDADLVRYKTMFRQDYLERLSSSMEKAVFLCEASLTLKNFDDLPLELDKYMKVTSNDIIGIVNRYFTADNSIILNVKTK
jgi:zinc protease